MLKNNKFYWTIALISVFSACTPTKKMPETSNADALKRKFEQAEDYSTFIAKNSERGYDGEIDLFPDRDGLASEEDSLAFAAKKGDVVGPFHESKGGFQLVKVVGTYETKQLKARHILLQMSEVPLQAQDNFANKIINEIKNGKSFEMLAAQYSNDQTNKNKGGELGWFEPNAMVQDFAEAVKKQPKDVLFTVRTIFGLHIVQKQEELQDRRTGIRLVRLFKQ
jgi:parvulin-like peptidyl-prolyl isomerase